MVKLRIFSCQTVILNTVIKIKVENKSKAVILSSNSKCDDVAWMDKHILTAMTPVLGMKFAYISLFLKLFQNKWK